MSSAPPVCVGFRHLTGWYNSQRVGAAEVQLSTAGRLLPSTLTFGRAGWANPVMITGVGLLTLSVLTSTAGGIGGTGGASGDRSLRTTAAASPLVTGTAVPPWYTIHPVWRRCSRSRYRGCPRDSGESGLADQQLMPKVSVPIRLPFFNAKEQAVEHPKSILAAANKADEEHPDDIQAAVDMALGLIRQTAEYESWCLELARGMTERLIYQARHRANCKLRDQAQQSEELATVGAGRNEAGGARRTQPPPRRRISMASDAVVQAYRRYFEKRIGGKTLGHLTGEELEAVARSETDISNGHLKNARLCRRLRPLVPDGRRVMDCVTGPQLRDIMREVGCAL